MNISTALAEAGGTGVTPCLAAARDIPVPPATLTGVAALDVPEHVVEVDATAILD